MDLTGPVHLMLGSPGLPYPPLPDSPWRYWGLGPDGPVDPRLVAQAARLSPMSARAERSLVTAVATDDLDCLIRLADQGGGTHDAARVLLAGRLGPVDVTAAIEMTTSVLRDPVDPGTGKVLRRYFADLHVAAPLAPSVPALIPVSRVGLGLLLADMHLGTGRPTEALAVLRALPAHPAVRLALAATLLGNGEHDRVLSATNDLGNTDDVAALALVARSVAARTMNDLPTALDAACAALSHGDRSPGVLAAALEERSHLYSLAEQESAARADLEALAGLAAALGPVEVPEATPLARSGADSAAPVERSRDRARDRMRRRITGVGEPGTFGGRHHSTYRDEIAAMFALGQTDAVEELLLGLLDAVEDEVAELGAEFDPTFFLTLADLYQDNGRSEELAALKDRYAAAEARATQTTAGDAGDPAPGEGGAAPPVEVDPAATVVPEAEPDPDPEPDPEPAPEPHPVDAAPEASPTPTDEPVRTLVPAGRPPEEAATEPDEDAVGTVLVEEAERPLTPVERTVRGPRVRSL